MALATAAVKDDDTQGGGGCRDLACHAPSDLDEESVLVCRNFYGSVPPSACLRAKALLADTPDAQTVGSAPACAILGGSLP